MHPCTKKKNTFDSFSFTKNFNHFIASTSIIISILEMKFLFYIFLCPLSFYLTPPPSPITWVSASSKCILFCSLGFLYQHSFSFLLDPLFFLFFFLHVHSPSDPFSYSFTHSLSLSLLQFLLIFVSLENFFLSVWLLI